MVREHAGVDKQVSSEKNSLARFKDSGTGRWEGRNADGALGNATRRDGILGLRGGERYKGREDIALARVFFCRPQRSCYDTGFSGSKVRL